MPPFVLAFPVINVAGLSQSNSQTGLNLAVGLPGAGLPVVQTLGQMAGNTAAITQR